MQICAHDRGTAPLITQGEAIITGGCAAQVMEKPSLRATSTGLCHMYLQIELPSLSLSLCTLPQIFQPSFYFFLFISFPLKHSCSFSLRCLRTGSRGIVLVSGGGSG